MATLVTTPRIYRVNFEIFSQLGTKIGFFNEKTIFWGLWERGKGWELENTP